MVELDTKAVREWLTIGITLNRKTFEKGIKYKIPKILKYNGVADKSSVARVISAYEKSIIKTCENKNNILLQLSGGKDSRLIAALLKKNDIDFSAVVYGDGNCLDVRVAKMVARALKIPLKVFTNIKGAYNMEAVIAIIKATHGLRLYHGLLNQYYFRNYLRQFDIVLDGYGANYVFDSVSCFNYPVHPWIYLLERQLGFTPCCIDSKKVFLDFGKKYYDMTLEEAWINKINNSRALSFTAVQSWGINDVPVINQDVIDAIYALPYNERSGIRLTQKMMKSINKTLWLIPHATFGGFPLAAPYRKHLWLYERLPKNLPNWRFVDPSEAERNINRFFSDYIKTLPQFVRRLSILDTEKSLELLKTSSRFRDRLMSVKIWSEIHENKK